MTERFMNAIKKIIEGGYDGTTPRMGAMDDIPELPKELRPYKWCDMKNLPIVACYDYDGRRFFVKDGEWYQKDGRPVAICFDPVDLAKGREVRFWVGWFVAAGALSMGYIQPKSIDDGVLRWKYIPEDIKQIILDWFEDCKRRGV